MGSREVNAYTNGDVFHLVRMAGGWGNVAGPGLFMLRVALAGTVSSLVVGLGGAAIGAIAFGTAALPFLVCTSAGFIFGAMGFYRDSVRQSLEYLDRYPRLLQLHLDANYPTRGFLRYERGMLNSGYFGRSWILQSMLICSWLTAQPALDVSYSGLQSLLEGMC
jgi:hypothetical protein